MLAHLILEYNFRAFYAVHLRTYIRCRGKLRVSELFGNTFEGCPETSKTFKIGYQAAISGNWRYLAVNFVSHLTPIALHYLV